VNPYDTEGARVSAEGKALRDWERMNAECELLDQIEDEIWTDPALLVEAIENAHSELRICDAITIHARAILDERRAMADPEGER
jgi:hypothetical protein